MGDDDRDRADANLIRRTAQWLRSNPDRLRYAGLACITDTEALVTLLNLIAAELPHLDTGVRRQITESCREALGHTTGSPLRRHS